MKRCLFIFLFVSFCQSFQKNDEGGSWLGTSFNPFTYEHGSPVLEMGSFISDEGSDFKEQSNVQSIYDRQTSIVQTFKEVTTVQDYYESSQFDVEASGGFDIFSGSASFKETQSFNHSDLTQHRMFVGSVKETTRYLVFDHNAKNLTKGWAQRFEQFFNVLSKVPKWCPQLNFDDAESISNILKKTPKVYGACVPLRLSISLMNGMLKDAGWFVTGVKLGGSIVVRVTLDAEQISTLTEKQITDGVSAKFGPFFSASMSETTTQETLNSISSSVKYVEKQLLGGEGSFNDVQSDFSTWSKTIFEKPAVIGVKENILCDLITFERFSNYDTFMVAFAQNLCLSQITTLVDWNTPSGCAEPKNQLFDPNVLKSGHCVLDNNLTFGGFVQTSKSSLTNDPKATCQPTVFASPETEKNRTLCPEGWYPLAVTNHPLVVPSFYKVEDINRCWFSDSTWWDFCPCRLFGEWRYCHWYNIPFTCALDVSVCVKNHTDSKGKAYRKLFGGFYTIQQNNPLTNGQSCPEGFQSVPLLNNASFSCEAFPGSVDEKYAVPFGGLFSGNSPNLFTGKQNCPRGHSRHFMGLFFGVPWYVCMVFQSPFQQRVFHNLPTMPSSALIVIVNNKTFNLGEKERAFESDSTPPEKLNISTIILSIFLGLIILAIFPLAYFLNHRREKKIYDTVWGKTSIDDKDESIPLVIHGTNSLVVTGN